ncbi:MAG: D-alanyl-D-alanine carboxypeptidase [Clostridia bacterium]|nr:D-alanyl-D-alanine carboxypeptidase [Clostridia bacterium]
MSAFRRIFALLLVCLLLLAPSCAEQTGATPEGSEIQCASLPFDAPTVSASAAVLLDASNGSRRILWSRNGNERMSPASTTKVMTTLVAIEALPLSHKVTIPAEAVGVEGSSVYLTEGEEFTLEELLYCVMLESANDAATAVALAVAGSVEAFAALMNAKAAELGLENTHFVNPHGLDAEGHYTSAGDLALILAAALENEAFSKISATYKTTVGGPEGARLLVNHNRLLRSYEGSLGGKTGYTRASGRCLVSAAEREGLRLVAVTLADPDDWQDHTALLDAGFDQLCAVRLTVDGELSVAIAGGEQESLRCVCATSPIAVLRTQHGEITHEIEMERTLVAPVAAGDRVGRVVFYCDGAPIGESTIVTEYSAARKPRGSLWQRIKDFFVS